MSGNQTNLPTTVSMSNNSAILPNPTNASGTVATTTVSTAINNASANKNVTELQPLIFLQTQAAQGIAGTFAIAAFLITCHQVGSHL